jgi:hypothetical protein
MLQQFLIPQLDEDDQEDAFTSSTTGIAWPPRSPDLTLLNFLLWGFVKDRVFAPPLPANVVELLVRIITVVAEK